MKRISAFAIAALLAVSMSAFAKDNTKSTDTKSCDTAAAAAECQKKDANCTKKCTGDSKSCPKHDSTSCPKASSDKK